MINEFEEWYHHNHRSVSTVHYIGAEDAWDYKQEQVESIIKLIEDYPCCMSCYATIEEMKSAQRMKETILRIIKGEV